MRPSIVLASSTLVLAACNTDFAPSTRIDKLHVLAIQTEPPEIAPAGQANAQGAPDWTRLTSLVTSPKIAQDASAKSLVIYFACTPTLGAGGGDACSSFEVALDIGSFAQKVSAAGCRTSSAGAIATGIPGEAVFAGAEECTQSGCVAVTSAPLPGYALPPQVTLDALPPGLPQRVLGVNVSVLAVVVDAKEEDLFAGQNACSSLSKLGDLLSSREHVEAIKRISVRGPNADSAPNLNPRVHGIYEEIAQADGGTAPAEGSIDLLPELPTDGDGHPISDEQLHPTYYRHDESGKVVETVKEEWVFSWFSSTGDFDHALTRSFDKVNRWKPQTDVDAGVRPLRFYLVVRDLRGGTTWAVRDSALAH